MIPIFIHTTHEPSRCPHCHKLERQETRCAHCGYIYPDTGGGFIGIAAAMVGFLVSGVIAMITLLSWAMPGIEYRDPPTLVQVIADEWHWFIALLHRIW